MSTAVAARTQKKITQRLMPFLLLLYITAYVDRINVSFAGLDMTKDLGFSNEVFGFGSGIFFLGYCLLEIPGAMLTEVWSARRWISLTGSGYASHLRTAWPRWDSRAKKAGAWPRGSK